MWKMKFCLTRKRKLLKTTPWHLYLHTRAVSQWKSWAFFVAHGPVMILIREGLVVCLPSSASVNFGILLVLHKLLLVSKCSHNLLLLWVWQKTDWRDHCSSISLFQHLVPNSIVHHHQKYDWQVPADSSHFHARKSKCTVSFHADDPPPRVSVFSCYRGCTGKSQANSHCSRSTSVKPVTRKFMWAQCVQYPYICSFSYRKTVSG